MCPIETPEGPNIGLISSLSTYARVNELGFLETPYRKVKDGVVQQRPDRVPLGGSGRPVHHRAGERPARQEGGLHARQRSPAGTRGSFPVVPPEQVHYMDVSPMQLVSPAAALIPFLEHDDANRALMGSNMQRQAVPLLITEPPLVGTGLERKVAVDSGAMVLAKRPGGGRVGERGRDRRPARRRRRRASTTSPTPPASTSTTSASSSARTRTPASTRSRSSMKGERVEAGQVLADGPGTCEGTLALGANVLVAFMPWCGYNFEDAIVVSEGLIKRDIFTSVHIEQFELTVRDTKRGMEEITREIPNVGDEAVRNLDEDGIIRDRRPGQVGRHPGRQGHAEGRDRSHAGGAAAARDLRRQGRRRSRRVAQGPSGDGRRRHRHQGLLPQGEGRLDEEAGAAEAWTG